MADHDSAREETSHIPVILDALRAAQAELAAYAEPPAKDPKATISKLLGILDDQKLIAAQRAIDPKAAPSASDDLRDDPPPQSR